MASGAYNQLLTLCATGSLNWASDTIRVMLVSSAYTYDPDHSTVADVSASEIAPSGYARQTLGSKTATIDTGANVLPLDAADSAFGALGSGATIGGAVVFKRVGGSDASTDPLIAFADLTDTPTNGASITVAWDANGIVRLAVV